MSKQWLCIIIHHPDMTIRHFLVYIEHAHLRFKLCYLQEDRLLWVGRWVFLQSVASTLKCFSLQHICPKWSLIAHWRMHDIKCLQTWNNHVLSLLEIVCSGICINHHVEQNRSSHHTSEACPVFVLTMPVVHCVRDSIYFTGTSVNVTVFCFMETLRFPCAVEKTHWKPKLGSQQRCRRAQGFLGRHTSVHLSSGMNICGVAVFSHSRQFLYSFIKINFTWMSDLICCHKQFRL